MLRLAKRIRLLVGQISVFIIKKLINKKKNFLYQIKLNRVAKNLHFTSEKKLKYQKEKVFSNSVKFSIITPLYNTPKNYLIDLLTSLEKQTYQNWELCLIDGSEEKHEYIENICKKWSCKDTRIKYLRLIENKGIANNTNEGIKLASGEYIGLLDHDDILHESALFEMMAVIEQQNADFLYSDEVKFSGKPEEAVDFNFKPGFGKDELRSHNYICHFTVFSRKLLESDERYFRSEFDGSQDHDLVLRLTEKAEKIVHIPKVLYYWRVHPESVSMNLDSKEYAINAAISAVQEQIYRNNEPGSVECNLPYRSIYRVRYLIDAEAKKVDIIIHGVKKIKEYREFVQKVRSITSYKNIRYVPIMNKDENTFDKEVNQIVNQSDAKYIIIMDIQCVPLEEAWIEEMLMYAQRNDVAAVAPKILFLSNKIAYAGISLDNQKREKIRFLCQGMSDTEQGYEAMLKYVRNTTAVWRGCFMIERDKFKKLGGFSGDLQGYEEIDLSLKALEYGYWNVWTCFARVRLNRKKIVCNSVKNIEKFTAVWGDKLDKEDTFCHPYWKKLDLV